MSTSRAELATSQTAVNAKPPRFLDRQVVIRWRNAQTAER
jgi:hypothetical protein